MNISNLNSNQGNKTYTGKYIRVETDAVLRRYVVINTAHGLDADAYSCEEYVLNPRRDLIQEAGDAFVRGERVMAVASAYENNWRITEMEPYLLLFCDAGITVIIGDDGIYVVTIDSVKDVDSLEKAFEYAEELNHG